MTRLKRSASVTLQRERAPMDKCLHRAREDWGGLGLPEWGNIEETLGHSVKAKVYWGRRSPKRWVPGPGAGVGCGFNGIYVFNGYRISVLQDEKT